MISPYRSEESTITLTLVVADSVQAMWELFSAVLNACSKLVQSKIQTVLNETASAVYGTLYTFYKVFS